MNVFSVAISNVFLGLTIAGMLHCVVRHHMGVKELFLHRRTFFYILLILWGTVIISLPNALEPGRGLKEFFNYYIYRMMVFPAVLLCVHEKKKLINIALCMAAAMFINDLYSIVQGIMAYPKFGRFTGFMNVMPQASFLTVFVPASLVVIVAAKDAKWRWGSAIFCLTACLAFVFNGTRGAWLASLLIAFMLMFLQIKNIRNFLALVVATGIVLGGVYQAVPGFQQRVQSIANLQEQSNTERRLLWQSAWNMALDHPMTGVGLANFKKNYQEHYILPEAKEPHLGHAHNNFMHVLAECGMLGFSALLMLWGYILIYGVAGWYKYRKSVYLMLLATLMGLVLHGLTEYTWGTALTVKLFWLSIALCFKWIDLDKCATDC